MTFLYLFASFILLSILCAFIVFKFFRSRKTNSLLIVSQRGFANSTADILTDKKSIFKSRKKIIPVLANQFLLTNEEKNFQERNFNPLFNSADSSQMVLMDLAEFIFKNLNISELLNATTYHAIPIDSNTSTIPLSRLKKLKLVTKDDFFSENGFILLCTIAKYINVLEIGSTQILNRPLK